MAKEWDLYRLNNETGKTFVVEECNRRRLGVVVFNTLYDNLNLTRQEANRQAGDAVARLVAGERVEFGAYEFSVVGD